MTPKESTLSSLDNSIEELKKSIDTVSEPSLKKDLEKTLNNLMKARAKMNPCKPVSGFYLIIVPFVLIFVMIGGYYFARKEYSNN